jgi:RNA polymerase sigma-70 factor (ECF subfamily)
MAMKMPSPRRQPEALAGAASIDWQSVLATHGRWLRTVVGARLGEPQAVDEVMQEVSLAAVRQHAPLNDPEKVAPWLYRLAVRQTLLYRRKQGRRRKLIDRYAERNRPSESDARESDPLGWLMAEERREQVRKAMSRLAPRDAEILMLKYTEDWSYNALAEHLGISHSAIEARLHRARQRLRDELAVIEAVGIRD